MPIYAGPTAGVLDFNSLSASSYLSISETGGLITLNAQITSIYQDVGLLITNVGVPSYSVFNYSASVITFKSLSAGSYVSIFSTETSLIINSTFIDTPITNTDIAILSTSVGNGLPIYAGPTTGVIDYNSLSTSGSFISLSLLNGLITPQVSSTEISPFIMPIASNVAPILTSLGGGLPIYAGPSAGVLDFNSLSANGSYLSISETSGLITFNAQITSIYVDIGALITNVGIPSYSVFNYSSSVITFKSLSAGSYVSIISTETSLIINSTFIDTPITNTDIAILSTSVGNGLPIYAGPTAGVIDYNSLSTSGSFISLSLLNGLITPQVSSTEISPFIMPIASNVAPILTSLGGGLPIYAGPSAGVLDFNSLSASSYLSISETSGLITLNAQITSIYQDVGALITNVGVPSYSVFNYSASVITFKSLSAGSYVSIFSTETSLVINSTFIDTPLTNTDISLLSTSVGNGLPIYAGPTAGVIDYNSLSTSGSFISLSLLNGLITPQVSSTEISPFIMPIASNVVPILTSLGGGLPIYAGPSAGVLDFNSLSANGSYVSISETGGLITLNAQITSIYQDVGALITNVGVPSYSVFNYSASVITFKSLSAGSYVSITSTETSLIINSTFIDTPITNTSISLLSTSVGNGLPIYAGPTAGVLDYNSLSTNGSFISLSLLNGLITPQVSSTEISPFIVPTATNISLALTSIGNGLPIYAGPTAGVLDFNSLSASSYLNISEIGGLISLNAQITSIYQDVGALMTIVGIPSYSVFNYSSSVITFKSLSAGSYVSIFSTETSLIINSTFVATPITNTSISILSTSVGNGLPIYAGPTAGVIDYNSLSTSGSFISLSYLMA